MHDQGKVVTVQSTRKLYKAIGVVGAVVMLAGVATCAGALTTHSSTVPGSLMFIIGFLTSIVARFLTWWHHE